MSKRRRITTLVGVVALQLLSCGGTTPPECPTGSCTLPGRTTVKWMFDNYPEWLFPNDTCIDLGVANVHVDVTNVADATIGASFDQACSDAQGIFSDLPPGMYNVALTPVDSDGSSVVKAAIAGQVMAADPGGTTEVTINVPYTAWTHTYTGTLLFRLTWGGVSCEVATPNVSTQTLKLVSGGVVVNAVTDTGQKVDGTDPEPCRQLSESFAQYVEALPFGPVTLLVTGKDQSHKVRFEHQFDTFVGAGKNNPTITFDVPPPDAAIDAPVPDATGDAPVD